MGLQDSPWLLSLTIMEYYVRLSIHGCAGGKDAYDGFLLTLVYTGTTESTELRIYETITMSSTPLAVVELGLRVPYGIHSIHIAGTKHIRESANTKRPKKPDAKSSEE